MTYSKDNQIKQYVTGYGFMSFVKNFGSKHGKNFLNKGISASIRIKDTGNFIKNSASKFNQSKYGKILKIKDLAKGLKNQGSEFGKIAGKKSIKKICRSNRRFNWIKNCRKNNFTKSQG